MIPIGKIRASNLERLIQEFGTLESVAVAAETTAVYLSQLRRGAIDRKTGRPREMGTAIARRLEVGCNKPPGWMDAPEAPSWAAHEPPPSPYDLQSHPLRLQPVSNSPRINWGDEQMVDTLPATFSVAMPDDSMAPRVRRGDVIRFNRDLAPRPGDGVLLRDNQGGWFFRIYRESRPGAWEAHPLNEAYQPIDGPTNQLQILAVLTGIEEQRWG
jgi:hypothetical protein